MLVQGDTGPGNFMYENGKVTGVIDWELAHLGDPMDDIAWLSWRTTQHTFTHLPDRLREYEALSGFKIDDARVIYYRVNACVRLASSGSGPWGGFGLPGMGVKAPRAQIRRRRSRRIPIVPPTAAPSSSPCCTGGCGWRP